MRILSVLLNSLNKFMTIICNKVTWYSKLIAAIVLAGAVWLGMYFYAEFKKVGEINSGLQMVDTNASDWKEYSNSIYGFKMEFIDSWKGFAVDTTVWNGRLIDGDKAYSGPLLVFKNPNTTPAQSWQNIPIMVFTHDVWDMVVQEKVVVSAAPIGPSKVGENSNYVFATPPRWYGFTDAIGFEEAVEIVKTFKSFEVTDQTKGWNTYTNEKYRFELKYPADSLYKPDETLGEISFVKKDSGNVETVHRGVSVTLPLIKGDNPNIAETSGPLLWIESGVRDTTDCKSTRLGVSLNNSTLLNGIKFMNGFEIDNKGLGIGDDTGSKNYNYGYAVVHQNLCYQINFTFSANKIDDNLKNKRETLFKQILFTFKFTK
jgi:hypothetical protein